MTGEFVSSSVFTRGGMAEVLVTSFTTGRRHILFNFLKVVADSCCCAKPFPKVVEELLTVCVLFCVLFFQFPLDK